MIERVLITSAASAAPDYAGLSRELINNFSFARLVELGQHFRASRECTQKPLDFPPVPSPANPACESFAMAIAEMDGALSARRRGNEIHYSDRPYRGAT